MVTWTLSFQPSVSFILTAWRGERVGGTGRVQGGLPLLGTQLTGHSFLAIYSCGALWYGHS